MLNKSSYIEIDLWLQAKHVKSTFQASTLGLIILSIFFAPTTLVHKHNDVWKNCC